MVREPANRGTGESADDVSNPILMKMLKVSRGSLFICDTCYHIIEESGQIEGDRATSDAVIAELCPNCEDQNKPLLDDLLGSEE